MKSRSLLFILTLALPLMQLAQSGLTNMSFESWSNAGMFGNAPTGWFGFNLTKQTSGAQNGSNYVKISNANSTQGVLMLGAVGSGTIFKGGAPYTQMPVALTGFFKTSGLAANGSESVTIMSYTSKSGTINAIASFTQSANVATWTSFSAQFTSFGGLSAVDTIYIMASSGNLSGSGAQNSASVVLELDNFSLGSNPTTGIDARSLGTAFMVYPNPAADQLNIISKDERAVSVTITDINGRVMNEAAILDERTSISVQDYQAGIYFYAIRDAQGSTLLTSRFVVTK